MFPVMCTTCIVYTTVHSGHCMVKIEMSSIDQNENNTFTNAASQLEHTNTNTAIYTFIKWL